MVAQATVAAPTADAEATAAEDIRLRAMAADGQPPASVAAGTPLRAADRTAVAADPPTVAAALTAVVAADMGVNLHWFLSQRSSNE